MGKLQSGDISFDNAQRLHKNVYVNNIPVSLTHDPYGAVFSECQCRRCRARALRSRALRYHVGIEQANALCNEAEILERETDYAAEWGGINYP